MGVKEVVVSFEEALTDRTTFMDERLETTTGKYDTYLFTTMTVVASHLMGMASRLNIVRAAAL